VFECAPRLRRRRLCGSRSVGAHVRDAAAYVCWSLARAYDPTDAAPAIAVLAPALLAVACYDREARARARMPPALPPARAGRRRSQSGHAPAARGLQGARGRRTAQPYPTPYPCCAPRGAPAPCPEPRPTRRRRASRGRSARSQRASGAAPRAQVNCRRAAAAAFQEAVGRLGGLPHGIDVVAAADFFALAGRPQAFLAVGPAVAAFPEYRGALAEHLARRQARAARPGVGLGRLLGLGWVRC